MKTFPNNVLKVTVKFICDLCGVETTITSDMPANGSINVVATCPVCGKDFNVTLCKSDNGNDSWVKVEDIAEDDITLAF